MKYCCEPFASHMKNRYFVKMKLEPNPFLQKPYIGVLYVAKVGKMKRADLSIPCLEDLNLMPISFCPFCGKEVTKNEQIPKK